MIESNRERRIPDLFTLLPQNNPTHTSSSAPAPQPTSYRQASPLRRTGLMNQDDYLLLQRGKDVINGRRVSPVRGVSPARVLAKESENRAAYPERDARDERNPSSANHPFIPISAALTVPVVPMIRDVVHAMRSPVEEAYSRSRSTSRSNSRQHTFRDTPGAVFNNTSPGKVGGTATHASIYPCIMYPCFYDTCIGVSV